MRRENLFSGTLVAVAIGLATISCNDKNDVKPTPAPDDTKENTYAFVYGDKKVSGNAVGILTKLPDSSTTRSRYVLEIASPMSRYELFEVMIPVDSLNMDSVITTEGDFRFTHPDIVDSVVTTSVTVKLEIDAVNNQGTFSFKGSFSDTTNLPAKKPITKGKFNILANKK